MKYIRNLDDYYDGKIPPLLHRADLYDSFGFEEQGSYVGSYEQNLRLTGALAASIRMAEIKEWHNNHSAH